MPEAPPAQPMTPSKVMLFIFYALISACQLFDNFCEILIKKKKNVLSFFLTSFMITDFLIYNNQLSLGAGFLLLLIYGIYIVGIQCQHLKPLQCFRYLTIIMIFLILIIGIYNIIRVIILQSFESLFPRIFNKMFIFFGLLVQLHLLNEVIANVEQQPNSLPIFTIDDEPHLDGPNAV